MNTLHDFQLIESLVPPTAAHWAGLHLVRHGSLDRAVLFGHLVLSRLEAIADNERALQHLLESQLDLHNTIENPRGPENISN